ncbi:12483_t:CDS:2 [Entrophospora sp. SA101]|nr:12483_t:CDS:2 [Entrophospora sp. SA101]
MKRNISKSKKTLSVLPTNQLLQQVWDYIISRPNKKGEYKKSEMECLFLLCWKVGLRVSEALSFDLSLENQESAYKNLYLLRGKVKKEMNIADSIELAPHTLRRCFATHQAISGMPLPILQKVLGHSKVSTTALYIRDGELTLITGKKQLTERISKKTKTPQNQVTKIIESLLEETQKALVKGEEIRFLGYYSFKTTITKPRIAMNLQTKKKMKVPAKRVPKCKFATELTDRNEGQELNFTVEEATKLKNLNIEPLSVAKYFYEKAGPTLDSVFYAMDNYFEKNETYQGLFDKVKDIDNEVVINHLDNIHKQYKRYEVKKNELDFYEKAFMIKTLFDFSEMFVSCIHTDDFTNAIKREEAKILLANSFMVMQDCKARLFGILEKNKPIKHNNLFQALLLDPNHKTYRKSGKNVLTSLKDLICLFSEEDECQELAIQKSLKKNKRK